MVRDIIEDVKKQGDEALRRYTEKFDGVRLDSFRVTEEEIRDAYSKIEDSLLAVIREAIENITLFHSKQKRDSWFMTNPDGTVLGQKVTPLDSAGVYVPGGTAAYPSSVLMNVIPAQVAGVERIAMVSPPSKEGTIPAGVLVAANELGVTEIYKVGGAQAVAALAYGTETIKRVDKIVGPGNIYVATAKREVFGDVDIDMIAGPSEIAVVADESARANEAAADLLSQAEHDPLSRSILITTSSAFAEEVKREVDKQLEDLPRKDIAKASMDQNGKYLVAETKEEAIRMVNDLAPEHLELLVKDPFDWLGSIRHAGAIFMGRYSSEPVGDYFAGPNHVLPTSGTARFSSPLNVDDFTKKSSVIYYSREAFEKNAAKIAEFARYEGLEAHARAIEERLKERQ
ncbi:histidinol dehydrogenase [Bacillus sp. FJAT-42376]|nr:histidinol dehydrogenase [Bacillus sp. FJAT-42376]AZB44442.1 histidinol dehydrogenase [Bacillus sp. FJAT-42376]